MLLSDKIRIIRKARGLSQEGLGFSLSRVSKDGVSRQAVSDWETGKSEPCLDNIRDLAEVLGVSFDALLDETIDLDDPQVLEAVLNGRRAEKQEQKGIGASINYTIKANAISPKRFKITIAAAVFLAATIGCLIPYLTGGDVLGVFFIPVLLLGSIAFPMIVVSIAGEIIPAIKGRMTYLAGHMNYTTLAIDDYFVRMDGYERITNRLFVPIETILEMKVCNPKKCRHGDVELTIKDKVHPMYLIDVMQPHQLVKMFNTIKSVLERNKEE